MSILSSLLLILLAISTLSISSYALYSIREATIKDLQLGFEQNHLTSRQLVEFYLGEIRRLNLVLNGVIEVNPDALCQTDKLITSESCRRRHQGLHGIPILLKDNIATKDKLNTTAGSFALSAENRVC